MPVGTVVYDVDTDETLGDLTHAGERILVARGGGGGLGNQHFKSSTNRSPRRATTGYPGEKRELRLELKVIADVGMIGQPNAGKSTLISVVSATGRGSPIIHSRRSSRTWGLCRSASRRAS